MNSMEWMSNIKAIDWISGYLRSRTEPLSVSQCRKIGELIDRYVQLHDEQLMRDCFIEVEKAET